MEAEPAAGGPLPRRPRVSRRRLGAPGDPDRRPRHEHRRRRRDRSVLEAPGDAAGVGRAEPAATRTRSSGGRSATATSALRGTRRSGGGSGAQQYRPDIREATPSGQATRETLGADGRRRAAQDERDDWRRTRLSLCRIPDCGRRAGRARTPLSRVRADDVAGRAAAARLARRRHCAATIGSATAILCCAWDARPPIRSASRRAMRASGAPFEHADDRRRGAARVSTATTSSWCARICTWSGGATRRRTMPQRARRARHRSLMNRGTRCRSENRRLQSHLSEAVLRAAAGGHGEQGRDQALAPHSVPSRPGRALPDARGVRRRLPADPVAVCAADRVDQPGSPDHARSGGARQRLAGGARAQKYPSRFPGFIASLPLNHPEESVRGARARSHHSSARSACRCSRTSTACRWTTSGSSRCSRRPHRLELPDPAAPGARRRVRRLSRRSEVEVRDLVDLRLALRDERGDAAAGVLAAVRSPAGDPHRRRTTWAR